MKNVFLCLLAVSAMATERVKLSSYSNAYYGRRTASLKVLRRDEMTCAVNRDSLFGKYIWVQVGIIRARFLATDKFSKEKFTCKYLKLDLTEQGYKALGIKHTTWGRFIFSEDAP